MSDEFHNHLLNARRNHILDAALTVFAQKGFHPTTIRDIAKVAGIADGTLYNYFTNKTALLLAIFDRMRLRAQQDIDQSLLATMDIRSIMKTVLLGPMVVFQADNFELFRVIMSEIMVNAELRELYVQEIFQPTTMLAEQLIQQWVDQKRIKPIDVALTVRIMTATVMGLMTQYLMGDQPLRERWDEIPQFLTDLLLNGIEEIHP
jgi:TetR/AcrR family fatty acid metabolism transcriptional regulator